MEIIKQMWRHSRVFRVAVCVMGGGLILMVVTAGRSGNAPPSAQSGPPEIIEDLKQRVGGGVAGKCTQAGAKVVEAVGKVAHTTGRAAETAGKGVDAVDGAIDTVLRKVAPKRPLVGTP